MNLDVVFKNKILHLQNSISLLRFPTSQYYLKAQGALSAWEDKLLAMGWGGKEVGI